MGDYMNNKVDNKRRKEIENRIKNLICVYKDKPLFIPRETQEVFGNTKYENINIEVNKFTDIFKQKDSYSSNTLPKIVKKRNESVEILRTAYYETHKWISFSGKITDKLVVGLGGSSVYETDITFHHTYGIPYIPGQAVKGIFRNFMIRESFDSNEEDALKNEQFQYIFGTKESNGNVIFFDVFPSDFVLKKDVMTPHHQKYYGDEKGGILPLDNDEPIVIDFLVVKDAVFEFNIAILNSCKDELKTYIFENLIYALNFSGIGAKTSVGYGFFDINIVEAMKQSAELNTSMEKSIEIERMKEFESKNQLLVKKRFEDETKGLSDIEIELYKINNITNKLEKNEKLMLLYNRIEELSNLEQKILAIALMSYLQGEAKWRVRGGKQDKSGDRIKKICKILNMELPC
jgi:CRISPR-associated protein Cmr6